MALATYVRGDGTTVRAVQFDGRVAAFVTLLRDFTGSVAPHPDRDDAVLVTMRSGRKVRIGTGDWVVEDQDGSRRIEPDDQFRACYHQPEAIP